MKSYIMKYISFAILAVGIIGSIISGAVFQTYNFEKQKFVFNVELTIISIIMILLLSFIFFTFSIILEKLEILERLQLKMLKQNDKTIKNKVEAAKIPVIQRTANESTSSRNVNAEDLTNNKTKESESTNEQKRKFLAIIITSIFLVLLLVTLLLK